MSRIFVLSTVVCGVLLGNWQASTPCFSAEAARAGGPHPRKPNVILVVTDDQGYGDMSCHGNQVLQTPAIDALHRDGLCLTDFHVNPCCSPTRAALMTGRYSSRVGVWHTVLGRSLLRAGETTMANVFAANGYRTGMFGKWHLGDSYPFRPHDRGFQEALYHGGGAIGNSPDYWGNHYFDDTSFRNGKPEKFQGYCTDVWFGEAIQFIRANKDRPFFCYLPTNVPHYPLLVAEKYFQPFAGKVPDSMAHYYGMLVNFDENLARLRRELRQLGLEENTILIFLSDNGTADGVELDKDGYPTAGFNAGMKGDKLSEYEGGHRVPCLVSWPAGGIHGGREVTRLAAHIDLLPTLIDLCGPLPERGRLRLRAVGPGGGAAAAVGRRRRAGADGLRHRGAAVQRPQHQGRQVPLDRHARASASTSRSPPGQTSGCARRSPTRIDRAGINKVLYGGRSNLGYDTFWEPTVFPGSPTPTVRKQNIAKAKALLKAAGKPNLAFTLTTSQYLENPQYAQLIQAMCKKAGINVTLNIMSYDAYYAGTNANTPWLNAQTTITEWGSRALPGQFARPYSCRPPPGMPPTRATRPSPRPSTPTSRPPTWPTRKKLATKLSALQQDDVPIMMAFFITQLRSQKKTVHGIGVPAPTTSTSARRTSASEVDDRPLTKRQA